MTETRENKKFESLIGDMNTDTIKTIGLRGKFDFMPPNMSP